MAADIFGLVGTTIDNKYRISALVGEGGFGVVYRAWHLSFECDIAVKCLKVPPHFTQHARQLFFENFRKEGRLLNALSARHPSIVRVYDFGVTQGAGVPYLVLEWLEGSDLETALGQRARSFTELEALALLRPAVEAIAKAHGMSPAVAHRDLKPANLFVVEGERGATLKVLDFGIAKAMQEGETATQVATRTASGFSAFSPQYGAPEQFLSKKYGSTGPWTDVHALGLILVELVTGRPPLDGETQFELVGPATSADRPTPRGRGAQVSEAFEAMCARAVSLRPGERYASASELLAAMDGIAKASKPPAARVPAKAVVGTQLPVGTYVPGSVPQAVVRQEVGAAADPTRPMTELARPVSTFVPEPKVETELTAERDAPSRGDGNRTLKIAVAAGAGAVGLIALVVAVSSKPDDAPSVPTASDPAAITASSPTPSSPAPFVVPAGYVRVEPGTFLMGSPDNEPGRDGDETQHRVTLTRAFLIKATEVTQGEWEAVMGWNPSHFKECGASCPVEQMIWYEAIAYANAVSLKEGLERCYRDGSKEYDAASASGSATPEWAAGLSCEGYRLPTEAEWEYAARAGTTTAFYTGAITQPDGEDPNLDKAGWYHKNAGGKTQPVKGKASNAWGLYDMHGNVWEWVWDWKGDYGSGEQKDPLGPATGSNRVLRGGSWINYAGVCRSALRAPGPDNRFSGLGLRLSRSIP
jgi:formylglycine-generating enzyme required for sulfatase activity/serine/threonine protein kinase